MNHLFTAVATAAVVASSSLAHAGGYVSLGIAGDAALSGDLDDNFTTDGDDNGLRIALGQRFSRVALEVTMSGTELSGVTPLTGNGDHALAALGVGGKVFVPIAGNFEAIVKAGLHRSWVLRDRDITDSSYSGRGYFFGGGLQYRLTLGIIGEAAIWADYTVEQHELTDAGNPDLSGATRQLMIGASLGL